MECIECIKSPQCKHKRDFSKYNKYCSDFKYFLDDLNQGEITVAERKPTITEKVEKKSSVKVEKGKGLFE